MFSANRRWVIIYNGEIYNTDRLKSEIGLARLAYRGHSDTEVLVEAISKWGVAGAMRRSVGMAALAVWDCRDQELWLARDRFE